MLTIPQATGPVGYSIGLIGLAENQLAGTNLLAFMTTNRIFDGDAYRVYPY